MTEKSPASSIHSVEPVPSSYDGGSDAGPAAGNVADEHAAQSDNSGGDDGAGEASSQPAAKSTAESLKPADGSAAVAAEPAATANEMEKLSLSTLKELTVVSWTHRGSTGPAQPLLRTTATTNNFVVITNREGYALTGTADIYQ